MRQSEPTQLTQSRRWVPRWARLLDDLDPVIGPDGRREAASPADERRLGDRQKTLAGAVGAALAAATVAVLVWQGAGALVRGALGTGRPPESRQASGTPAERPRSVPPAALTEARPTAAPTMALPVSSTPTAAAVPTASAVPAAPTVPAVSAAQAALTVQADRVAPTAPATPATQAALAAPPTAKVHTVEKGDTLFSIARRNGTTVGALVAANGLAGSDAILSVGRQLVVP
jgi:LysM repeat protein